MSLEDQRTPPAAEALLPAVYAELRQVAARYLAGQARQVTLQPTLLVHEAFLRLREREAGFTDEEHFKAVAATAMRHVLIDHVRRAQALKRGGPAANLTLDDRLVGAEPAHDPVDLLALDQALRDLERLSPRQARVVELLFFGGLSIDEVAQHLEVSRSLIDKELRRARAWIRRRLEAP